MCEHRRQAQGALNPIHLPDMLRRECDKAVSFHSGTLLQKSTSFSGGFWWHLRRTWNPLTRSSAVTIYFGDGTCLQASWMQKCGLTLCMSLEARKILRSVVKMLRIQWIDTFQDIVQLLTPSRYLYSLTALFVDHCSCGETHWNQLPGCTECPIAMSVPTAGAVANSFLCAV